MKIVAILIIGYFAIGFLGTGFVIGAATKKPKPTTTLEPETPPLTIPLTIVLALGFLSLPFLAYRKAKKQGTFLYVSPKFWLMGPTVLFVLGVLTAVVTHFMVPEFFSS